MGATWEGDKGAPVWGGAGPGGALGGGGMSTIPPTHTPPPPLPLQVERSTVWRDMVAAERRTGAAVVAPRGGAPRSWLARNASTLWLAISLIVFTTLLSVEVGGRGGGCPQVLAVEVGLGGEMRGGSNNTPV